MNAKQRQLLEQKRRLLLVRLGELTEFVRGSVVLMKRKCTYAGCRKCASGERHPTWVLTYSREGKTRTVYLGEKRRAEAQRMVAAYRRRMDLVEQVGEINLALLTDKVPKGREQAHGRAKQSSKFGRKGGGRERTP